MTKEAKQLIATGLIPLLVALAALVNAHAHKVDAEVAREAAKQEEAQRYELADSFQDYIEYVMKQRGCEP